MSRRLTGLYTVTAICVILLGGCTASPPTLLPANLFGQKASTPNPAAPDRCSMPEDCAAELKKLVKDPKRDWIGRAQSAEAYATGTRLFAYRALRKTLTCNELERALAEIDAAAPSLEPSRYARAHALMREVAQELGSERSNRCR
jgi:hypothetical protein